MREQEKNIELAYRFHLMSCSSCCCGWDDDDEMRSGRNIVMKIMNID